MLTQRDYTKGANDGAIDPGSKVSVNASTVVFAGNVDAISVRLHNPSETATIWLNYEGAAAVVGEGLPLGPKQTLIEDEYNGEIRGISSSGAVDVARQVI